MHISHETDRRLKELVRVFLEENSKLNLSAFRTPERCWIGNVLDSLAFLDLTLLTTDYSSSPSLGAEGKLQTILDIGTGGGFPLLPIVMTLPDVHCVGIDATRKKVEAVKRIVATLEIPNVDLHWGRAEELGADPAHAERYDVVTIRAVAKIVENLTLADPFMKPGGYVVLWKSMKEAIEVPKLLSFTLTQTHIYELPMDFGRRQLLVFEKTK